MNSRNHDIPPISKSDYPVNDSSNKVLADIDASLGPPLYTSLFRLYPTLAPHKEEISPAQGSDVDVPLQTSSLRTTSPFFVIDSWPSHAPSRPPTPDLKQLRLSVISKNLDPSKRICRFEVPGGGICRDEGCDDLHISRAAGQKGIEPTDEDTAEFLVNALPTSWLTSHNATYPKLHSVLQQIRSKAADLALEQRVAEALATFRPS